MKEVFLSDHRDVQSADTIEGKCTVHTFKSYTKLDAVGNDDYFSRFEYISATGEFNSNKAVVYVDVAFIHCIASVRCLIILMNFNSRIDPLINASVIKTGFILLVICSNCFRHTTANPADELHSRIDPLKTRNQVFLASEQIHTAGPCMFLSRRFIDVVEKY
ncbi:hypothetical protein QVD17_35135 [Tagetes erecta]|uniref:BAH domain-containing protein n=1 Tax=Tagetes erecta TaxID=13708 RepID=A0AAD8K0U8_TARER|nr:hypothetical protein QVD17_35135 [Tagetes erecta]